MRTFTLSKPLVTVFCGVVCVISVGSYYGYVHKKTSSAPVVKIVPEVSISTTTPDETPVLKRQYPSLPQPTEPEIIRIQSVGMDALIQRVGVDQFSQVAVPTNINLAGWFTHSNSPGEVGLSVIDGHVNGKGRDGVFAKLAQVKVGDVITVILANGTERTFHAVYVTNVPTTDAANQLFSQLPGVKSQLNLITCGGVYNPAVKDYTERTIVGAALN